MKIAICDDNQTVLNDESTLIHSVLDELYIEHSIDVFYSPVDLLNSNTKYEIVILDIEMEEMNGIQTAQKLKMVNKDCFIFFVTNYESYLDEAFNQRAFRYWTKPLDRRKLIYGFQSVIEELKSKQQEILITINNKPKQIFVRNIIYIYMENKKLHIVTIKGEIITNDTLKSVYEQLKDIDYFVESARGYYVNLNYVKGYTHNTIQCVCNQKTYNIYISRRKYNQFHKAFIDWIGGKE